MRDGFVIIRFEDFSIIDRVIQIFAKLTMLKVRKKLDVVHYGARSS